MMLGPWMKLTIDTTLLGLEAQSVIGLRLAQIAMGQGTPAEAQLMMTEKMLAFMDAATTVAAGGSAHTIVERLSKARASQCTAPQTGLSPPTKRRLAVAFQVLLCLPIERLYASCR